MKSSPLIIAHRGASGEAPENTLKAFELAHRQKADGVEADVFLTRDGEVVVTHDENAKRLTGTDLWVQQSTLTELKTLNYGQGEKIPTLKELFGFAATRFQILNIEIKSTGLFTNGIEKAVIELVRQWKLTEQVLVSSFNPLHLIRMRRLAPEIRRGFLITPEQRIARAPFWIDWIRPSTLNLNVEWASPERLASYQKKDLPIWVWTINEETEMNYWIQKPVAAIITNYPARLKNIRGY